MSQCVAKRMRVNIIDMTPQGKEFDYLRPNRKITCRKDDKFNVLLLEIELDGWSRSLVCV